MSMPKIILVPTDFGEPSEAALDCALEYARVFGSAVVLLHAFEVPVIGFPDGAMVATADLTMRILEGARIGLERQVKSRAGSGVEIRSILKEGDPYRMINEAADEIGADLIAMGTHGRRGLSRALIGSVVEKVVRTAHVPVLTMHGESSTAARRNKPASASSAIEAAPSSTLEGGHEPGVPASHH